MVTAKGGIAVFDSGIGGLTVLAECRKHLPDALFYYYGDNQNAPYGNLSNAQIYQYTKKAFDMFQELQPHAAVIACNTVTAVCAEELRRRYAFPIIGTEPAVLTAAQKGGKIFVLVTRGTYASAKFRSLCNEAAKRYPQAEILPIACDDLAGAIERNLRKKNFDFRLYLPKGTPSAVVLGCTHYIYIKEAVKEFYGCEVFDGNVGVAKRLLEVIQKQGFFCKECKKNMCNREMEPRITTLNIEDEKKAKNDLFENLFSSEKWSETEGVVFLGSGQVVNKTQYEQMFARKI